MFDGVVCSNGLVWTHDRRTLYYIDSGTGRVDAFDYDEASGGISNRRPAISFPKDQGVPDGMTIDAEGKLWVAIFNGKAKGGEGRVLYCDPVQGTVQGQVRVPGAGAVTSCAFGGPKMDELFITTASVHLQPETAGEQPHAGRLFRVKTPTHGLKAYRYKG
jgi:sugar lactone lactonase YvrE